MIVDYHAQCVEIILLRKLVPSIYIDENSTLCMILVIPELQNPVKMKIKGIPMIYLSTYSPS